MKSSREGRSSAGLLVLRVSSWQPQLSLFVLIKYFLDLHQSLTPRGKTFRPAEDLSSLGALRTMQKRILASKELCYHVYVCKKFGDGH